MSTAKLKEDTKKVIDLSDKKMKIDKAGNILLEKPTKDFSDLPIEEKKVIREGLLKAVEKKAKKKFKFIPIKEYYPYVEKLDYIRDEVCHMCNKSMFYERGVRFFIPATKNGFFALCSVCLGSVHKATMAYKTNDLMNGSIHSKIGGRNIMMTNLRDIRVSKDKKDKRSTNEINDELIVETMKELGIPDE